MIVVAAVGDCGSGAVGPDPAAGAVFALSLWQCWC